MCAFPNNVHLTEFTSCGFQSSCRNIWWMISGNMMHLKPPTPADSHTDDRCHWLTINRVAELQSTLDCWVTCIAVHALYLSKMTRGIFAWLKVTISNLRSVYQRCSGASCIWLPVLLVFCTKWCNNEGGLALNSSASPLPKCPAEVQFGKLNQMSAAIYETNKRLNNMCWCWPWLQLPEKEETQELKL